MSRYTELFSKAHMAYLEQQFDDAEKHAREFLAEFPDRPLSNTIRVNLGSVLDEDGKPPEAIQESKEIFLDAINRIANLPDFMKMESSADADPILHMGVWHARRGNHNSAAIYLLIDYLLSTVESNSHELLYESLREIDPETSSHMQKLIEKIKTDYSIKKKRKQANNQLKPVARKTRAS